MLRFGEMKNTLNEHRVALFFVCLVQLSLAAALAGAQTPTSSGPVFRLDGGNTTYAFGVNERGDLQALYWGGRLGPNDVIAPALSFPEWASFDSPNTTTPHEFAG